jgi:hypothetical protein
MGPGAGLGSVGQDRSQELGSRWPERNLNLIPQWLEPSPASATVVPTRTSESNFRVRTAGIPEFGYEF